MSRRAQTILERLVADRSITSEGRNFLVGSLDPFHDSEIPLDGFPDITSSRSVTQFVQYTTTISKPASVTSSTWDLHLCNVPVSPDLSVTPVGTIGSATVTPGAVVAIGSLPPLCNGFSAFACPSGAPYWAGEQLGFPLALAPSYSRGVHRVFGFGFEAVNVTAPLYQQGSVTVYKRPSHCVPGVVRETAGDSQYCPFLSGPAPTSAEAALFPNSRTWSAKDGCYGIATLNDIDCPVIDSTPGTFFIRRNIPPALGDITDGWCPMPSDSSRCHVYPFDITGAIFTGLSPETSLTVTVRYLIERFPGPDNADLIVLGRPSPAYDPLVLELYSRCLEHLPSVVPVGENPLGEWFAKVLGSIAKYAPAVASVIPHPVVSTIVRGAGMLAGAGHGALSARNARKKKQATPAKRSRGPIVEEIEEEVVLPARKPRNRKSIAAPSSSAVVVRRHRPKRN